MKEKRTEQVEAAILAASGKEDWAEVTEADTPRIVTLDLSGESITQLKAHDFAGLGSLLRLDLNNNELKSLPEGIFSGLGSLQKLSLSNNQIESLPEGIFFPV